MKNPKLRVISKHRKKAKIRKEKIKASLAKKKEVKA